MQYREACWPIFNERTKERTTMYIVQMSRHRVSESKIGDYVTR